MPDLTPAGDAAQPGPRRDTLIADNVNAKGAAAPAQPSAPSLANLDLSSAMSARPGFPDGLKVLLVDEDLASLNEAKKLLEECHFDVTPFNSGKEALENLKSGKDLYDIGMFAASLLLEGPLASELGRTAMEINQLPVILVTNSPSISSVMRGVQLGAVDVFQKPLARHRLINIWQHAVRKILGHQLPAKPPANDSTITVSEEAANNAPRTATPTEAAAESTPTARTPPPTAPATRRAAAPAYLGTSSGDEAPPHGNQPAETATAVAFNDALPLADIGPLPAPPDQPSPIGLAGPTKASKAKAKSKAAPAAASGGDAMNNIFLSGDVGAAAAAPPPPPPPPHGLYMMGPPPMNGGSTAPYTQPGRWTGTGPAGPPPPPSHHYPPCGPPGYPMPSYGSMAPHGGLAPYGGGYGGFPSTFDPGRFDAPYDPYGGSRSAPPSLLRDGIHGPLAGLDSAPVAPPAPLPRQDTPTIDLPTIDEMRQDPVASNSPGPLGLSLKKTDSFLNLLETSVPSVSAADATAAGDPPFNPTTHLPQA